MRKATIVCPDSYHLRDSQIDQPHHSHRAEDEEACRSLRLVNCRGQWNTQSITCQRGPSAVT